MDREVRRPLRPGVRGDAGKDSGAPEGARSGAGRHRTAAAESDRHTRDAQRPGSLAVPHAGLHPAVGHAERRRAASLRPDGRGVRRIPRARRPPHRPVARLPRADRTVGQHHCRRRVRQRRERRRRPERLGQRDEVRQRDRRRSGGEPRQARRPGWHEDLQPLPERLGDGVQHALQDVEALRVQRRCGGSLHHLVAEGRPGARRAPPPVPPRDRHRPDDPRRTRRRHPRDDQGTHPERLRAG